MRVRKRGSATPPPFACAAAPRLAEAWKRAQAKAAPIIAQAAFERAVIGWKEAILHKGEIVAYNRRFSDAAPPVADREAVAERLIPSGFTSAFRNRQPGGR